MPLLAEPLTDRPVVRFIGSDHPDITDSGLALWAPTIAEWLDDALFERAQRAAQMAGYSSVEEFVTHVIENEIQRLKIDEVEGQVADQLRGLGYIE